jgi:3',5'-cyclic AMP phosphodiesterase CpdA
MRTIAHISDLHFGTEDREVAAALLGELDGSTAPRPSLVAISGDLTQRARPRQFRAARAFLDRLPGPTIVVPGNHDVPLYDLATRLLRPLSRYQRYISDCLMPIYVDPEIAVVGVNTAHGLTIKGGRITREAVAAVRGALAGVASRWKLLVAHHPFVVPASGDESDRPRGADQAIPILEEAGVQVIMTGHLHIGFSSDPTAFRSQDHAIIAAHAGTCMSTRRRGEPNGYNLLTIDGGQISIAHRVWDGDRFFVGTSKTYHREHGEIVRGPEVAARR